MIDTLAAGPVDVVGDVHGEAEKMDALLSRLGHDEERDHEEKRQLVFVGDLVDRGPDNAAVVERVMNLTARNRARCLLGNHELKLVLGKRTARNQWFFNSTNGSRSLDCSQRKTFIDFFRSLPLVLERPDLRIVHACWNSKAIEHLRSACDMSISSTDLHEKHKMMINRDLKENGVLRQYRDERKMHADKFCAPEVLPAHADVVVRRQMENPVNVVTHGEIRKIKAPFWNGRRWRAAVNFAWWEDYDEDIPVIIGHYSRCGCTGSTDARQRAQSCLFKGIGPRDWMGPRRNVYCIDHAAGKGRHDFCDTHTDSTNNLAALRIPEWQVWWYDGSVQQLNPPNTLTALFDKKPAISPTRRTRAVTG